MRAKSLALLILALGCGLVASIGITQVMAKRDTGASKTSGETLPVFVAMKEIPLGEPLTAEIVGLEQWPKDKMPEGAIGKIEDIEGRKCRTKLYAGEPILEKKLGDPNKASELIPAGYRVVSVRLDLDSSGGGLIDAGDRVDLLVHIVRNPSRGIMQTSTRTFLQDVKVFAVNNVYDPDAASDEDKSKDAKTVSLLVTPSQAQEVMFAGELGKIRMVMRNSSDDNLDEVAEIDIESLFPKEEEEKAAEGGNGQGLQSFLDSMQKSRTPEPALAEAQNATDASSHTMRIIDGSEIHDVQLHSTANGDPSGTGGWTTDNPVREQATPPGDADGTDEDQAATEED